MPNTQAATGRTRIPLRYGMAIVLTAALGIIPTAGAQPTGNPKGTVTPPETSAPKGRASGAATRSDGAEHGKLVGTPAQTRARVQGAPPPGGGTAGGLPRRESTEASGETARSDKGSAAPRPVPPSR